MSNQEKRTRKRAHAQMYARTYTPVTDKEERLARVADKNAVPHARDVHDERRDVLALCLPQQLALPKVVPVTMCFFIIIIERLWHVSDDRCFIKRACMKCA